MKGKKQRGIKGKENLVNGVYALTLCPQTKAVFLPRMDALSS